jgi:ferritin-like metal-binding protein YciE
MMFPAMVGDEELAQVSSERTSSTPQKNYEIAAYDTLCAFANLLAESQDASLPRQTWDEEKSTDQRLTELSQDENVAAHDRGAQQENHDSPAGAIG